MKFNIPEQKAVVKSLTGANIGDKVIFSHRVEINHVLCNVTVNKVYEVVRIDMMGRTVIKGDNGMDNYAGAKGGCRGEYDIIERAPQKEPEFQPITVTLETKGDVSLMAAFFGAVKDSDVRKFGSVPISTTQWNKLHDAGNENRPRFETLTLKD